MSRPGLSARIDGIFFGQIEELWEGRGPSAINKTAASPAAHKIDEVGFTGDAQADPENHGGPDKAIHHYAADHYQAWIKEGEIPAGSVPAAFGENITTMGMTEENTCIGDILRLGTTVVQISQGRQPCWKVSEHTSNKKMAYLFQKTSRTGWYYRVLEPGETKTGDSITLIERPQPDWTVAQVTEARLTRRVSEKNAAILAGLPELADGWRQSFARMAAGDRSEDTSRRLGK